MWARNPGRLPVGVGFWTRGKGHGRTVKNKGRCLLSAWSCNALCKRTPRTVSCTELRGLHTGEVGPAWLSAGKWSGLGADFLWFCGSVISMEWCNLPELKEQAGLEALQGSIQFCYLACLGHSEWMSEAAG